MRQRMSASSWTQGTPAGLPSGMPGIGLVMEGAMQQAPQRGLHVAGGVEKAVEKVGGAAGIGGLSVQVARRRQPA
jgi:oxygen-independent coproporphyrinogen-3 oxidase